MNFRIESKPSFRIAGTALKVSTKDMAQMKTIPAFWESCRQDGTLDKMTKLSESQVLPEGSKLGICTDFSENWDEFVYIIGVETDQEIVECCNVTKVVPAADWAVFESHGPMPDSIQSIWMSIFSDFFVNEQFVHGAGPDLEVYPPGDTHDSSYKCEVWVPVLPKN